MKFRAKDAANPLPSSSDLQRTSTAREVWPAVEPTRRASARVGRTTQASEGAPFQARPPSPSVEVLPRAAGRPRADSTVEHPGAAVLGARSLLTGDFPGTAGVRAKSLGTGDFPGTAGVRSQSLGTGKIPLHLEGSVFYRKQLPEISKDQMTAGTLLFWSPHPLDAESEKAARRHGIIGQAQRFLHWLSPHEYAGSQASIGHVAMWLKSKEGDPEVGHAGRLGVVAQDLRPGTWVAYRPVNQELGDGAAQAMTRWTLNETLQYSTPKAMSSVPKAALFGSQGNLRELGELQHRASENALTATPSFAKGGTFCSEIASHAYLSGAMTLKMEPVLRTVPERTTPSGLYAQVSKGDAFAPAGMLHVPRPKVAETASEPKVPSPQALGSHGSSHSAWGQFVDLDAEEEKREIEAPSPDEYWR